MKTLWNTALLAFNAWLYIYVVCGLYGKLAHLIVPSLDADGGFWPLALPDVFKNDVCANVLIGLAFGMCCFMLALTPYVIGLLIRILSKDRGCRMSVLNRMRFGHAELAVAIVSFAMLFLERLRLPEFVWQSEAIDSDLAALFPVFGFAIMGFIWIWRALFALDRFARKRGDRSVEAWRERIGDEAYGEVGRLDFRMLLFGWIPLLVVMKILLRCVRVMPLFME